jgi:WD40 repeat protein
MVLQGSTLMLVDLESGATTDLVDVPGQYYSTAVSDDGRYIGYVTENAEGQGVTRIWDVEAGEAVATGPHVRYGLAFIPGTGIMVLGDNGLPFLDAGTGETVDHTIAGRSTTEFVAVTPDGEYLLTGSGFVVFDSTTTYEEGKVWDLSVEIDGSRVIPSTRAADVSADGRLVAIAVNSGNYPELRSIQIWDAEADEPLQVIPFELESDSSGAGAESVAFSPDGRLVAAGFDEDGWSGHLRIYDVASGEMVADLEPPGPVYQLAFSPDGRFLAAGTYQRFGLVVYAVGS